MSIQDRLLLSLYSGYPTPTRLYINAHTYMWLLQDMGLHNVTPYFPNTLKTVYGIEPHIDNGLLDGWFVLL